jgi:hypothetical protein
MRPRRTSKTCLLKPLRLWYMRSARRPKRARLHAHCGQGMGAHPRLRIMTSDDVSFIDEDLVTYRSNCRML